MSRAAHATPSPFDAPDLPVDVAARLEARRQRIVERLERHCRREDVVLFDDRWMHPDEVKRHYRRMFLRDLRVGLEMIVLFVLMLGATGVVALALRIVAGIR
ncbi:MAG: hypothetical protein CMJ18_11465 [Phycisphaeraceae bacterium]|nr:hypothetical protein [Phycisphaeraceae bacterium]